MNEIVLSHQNFTWVNVINPSPEELSEIAQKYNINQALTLDCLEPEHLPKYEHVEGLHYFIFRSYDEMSSFDADTVRELTRKIAIFHTDTFLLTVHRLEQPFIAATKEKWKQAKMLKENPIDQIVLDLASGVLTSYKFSVDASLKQLENLELSVFGAQGARTFNIQEGYYLKRKASVYRWMLRATQDLIPNLANHKMNVKKKLPQQDLQDLAHRYSFHADQLAESVNSLLNLHLSLASQKTNEVVQVLTIISVFLLPLNVLTGIYGMNFENLPGLQSNFGYQSMVLAMILISSFTYFGFKKKGWLK